MAHGHPDYWGYSSAQLPVPGIEQIPVIIENSQAVPPGMEVAIADYWPAAGEDAFIVGGMITVDAPGINSYHFRLDATVHETIYFDSVSMLPFNPSALYRIPSGAHFQVRGANYDAVGHTFSVFLPAFRVTLVPGAPAPVGLGLTVLGAGV